jgi:hypothetical protein
MMNCVLMIVLAAMLVTSGNAAIATAHSRPVALAAGDRHPVAPGVRPGLRPLAKTWTTRGQETKAGPQVLAAAALTGPGFFLAEGKGFEPSTGCPAPDFELRRNVRLTFDYPSFPVCS